MTNCRCTRKAQRAECAIQANLNESDRGRLHGFEHSPVRLRGHRLARGLTVDAHCRSSPACKVVCRWIPLALPVADDLVRNFRLRLDKLDALPLDAASERGTH